MTGFAARGIDSYRRIEVEIRTPLELVVMLYDGALRFTGDARSAIERGDVLTRRTGIIRALAIVSELQSTLDIKAGGDLAMSLDSLYTFVTDRLTEASVKQDVQPLDEAIRVLATLREGWVGISTNAAERAVK